MPRCRRQMAGKPEEVGLSSAQLKRLEAATKQQHRRRADARRGHAGGAARQARLGVGAGQARARCGRSDEVRFDLPHLFHDQADHQPRAHAARRGRPPAGLRSGREVPAGDRQDEGRHRGHGRRPADAAVQRSRAGDDGAGPAAPHRRPDLRQSRHVAGQQGLHRRQGRRSHRDQRGDGAAPVRRAAAVHAGRALGVQRVGRRAGPPDRGADRQEAQRGVRRARVQAARHGRHLLPGAGRQARRASRSPARSPTVRR